METVLTCGLYDTHFFSTASIWISVPTGLASRMRFSSRETLAYYACAPSSPCATVVDISRHRVECRKLP